MKRIEPHPDHRWRDVSAVSWIMLGIAIPFTFWNVYEVVAAVMGRSSWWAGVIFGGCLAIWTLNLWRWPELARLDMDIARLDREFERARNDYRRSLRP